MIVQCPQCQSKSRVDDAGAARGARVRCASCAHIFLPNTAIVPQKAPGTAQSALRSQASAAAAAQEEFGGKTSLFTGVVSREFIGRSAAGPPAASQAPQPQAMQMLATQVDPTARGAARPPAGSASAAGDFAANRTQAIDVSQLAAFSARLPAVQETFAAPRGGLNTAASPGASVAAARTPAAGAPKAPPTPRAFVSELDESTTAVVGTHQPGLLSGGATTASRLLGGMSAALGACGLIFFLAGNAVYAQAGLMGGSAIDISQAQSSQLTVEQVTSTLYDLADGHQALVALGRVVYPSGSVQSARLEVEFTLKDSAGLVVDQARGPVGAVLSLEELATISLPDSAAAELRRRVQQLPEVGPFGGERKFMAVIKDPKQPLTDLLQSLTLVPALAAEAMTDLQPAAANAASDAPNEPILDPELPQTAIPAPPPQALSSMPQSAAVSPVSQQSSQLEDQAKLRSLKNRRKTPVPGRRHR